MARHVHCPACGFFPGSLTDIDEGSSSDQGNGRPTFACSNRTRCGFTVQVKEVDEMRRIFRALKKTPKK